MSAVCRGTTGGDDTHRGAVCETELADPETCRFSGRHSDGKLAKCFFFFFVMSYFIPSLRQDVRFFGRGEVDFILEMSTRQTARSHVSQWKRS